MNKTTYNQPRKLQTQNNFRKRTPHSPIRSQKSFEENGQKHEPLKMELLLNRQYRTHPPTQPSPAPIGASTIPAPRRW